MDPNEALRLIRAHIKQLRVEDQTRDDGWIGRLTQQARDLSEAFEGLDEWLSRDGFLPAAWDSDDDKRARQFRVISDNHSNHNLPIGATVMWFGFVDGVDHYTQGGDGDEVAIDPRDLKEIQK